MDNQLCLCPFLLMCNVESYLQEAFQGHITMICISHVLNLPVHAVLELDLLDEASQFALLLLQSEHSGFEKADYAMTMIMVLTVTMIATVTVTATLTHLGKSNVMP